MIIKDDDPETFFFCGQLHLGRQRLSKAKRSIIRAEPAFKLKHKRLGTITQLQLELALRIGWNSIKEKEAIVCNSPLRVKLYRVADVVERVRICIDATAAGKEQSKSPAVELQDCSRRCQPASARQ